MKKIQLFLTILFCLASTVAAQDFRLSYNGKTGDVDLDAQIKDVNISATANTDGTLKEIEVAVGIPPKECERIVATYKISYGEVYLIGVIKLKSKKTLDEIFTLRSKGLGWGVIAKRLGVHPSELNKAMRDLRKSHKQKHAPGKGKGKGKGS